MKAYNKVTELADCNSIPEALGITDNRVEYLKNAIVAMANSNDRITQSFEKLWEVCDHPNEYAWCLFIYGANIGRKDAEIEFIKKMTGNNS